jgi:hypothetical protein
MVRIGPMEGRKGCWFATTCISSGACYMANPCLRSGVPSQPADPTEFFETRIRPLLAQNCFTCHTTTRLGGLEMKSREVFLEGGNSGPAIIPGEPEQKPFDRRC